MNDITDPYGGGASYNPAPNAAIDDGTSAWFMARLGNAVDVSIDRIINKPQLVYDAGQAYGVDGNGNLYQLGQQNRVGASTVTAGLSPNMLLLLLIVGAVVLANK